MIVRILLIVLAYIGQVVTAAHFEKWSPCGLHKGNEKRALVTGISGMLGSHVAEALLDQGYEVHGVVRPRSNMRNIASFRSRIEVVVGDLADPWRTLRMVKKVKPNYIFHFAAQAFNSLSYEEPENTLTTNSVTTLNILEAVRELDLHNYTRILIAGSSTVYGASTGEWDGPIPETAAMKPVSPYGVSKATSELLALQYVRTHGLSVVIPRFFIHVAPRGVEILALHEFARQIASIEQGLQEPVLLHGDISTQRDITDIVDSAPVVVCLAEAAPSGTVVNVGSNASYTMKDLLQTAIEASSRASEIELKLDTSRLRAYDEKSVMADITLLRKLTGWQPAPDMPKLIQQLLDYWRQEVSSRSLIASRDASGGRASAASVSATPPTRNNREL